MIMYLHKEGCEGSTCASSSRFMTVILSQCQGSLQALRLIFASCGSDVSGYLVPIRPWNSDICSVPSVSCLKLDRQRRLLGYRALDQERGPARQRCVRQVRLLSVLGTMGSPLSAGTLTFKLLSAVRADNMSASAPIGLPRKLQSWMVSPVSCDCQEWHNMLS